MERRISDALDELDYPLIRITDSGTLAIRILKKGDSREIYSIPYLILRMIQDRYEVLRYFNKLIHEINEIEIKESFIEFIGITHDVYSGLQEKDPRTEEVLFDLVKEFIPQQIYERIHQAYKNQSNYELANRFVLNLSSAERNLFNYETRRNIRHHTAEERTLRDEFKTQYLLSQLFAPRQKEILMKRYLNLPLTKAEREYYSRIIKKKIDAMLNPEIRTILEKTRSE